jgi:hypothetical protein
MRWSRKAGSRHYSACASIEHCAKCKLELVCSENGSNQSQLSPSLTRRRKSCASICTFRAISGSWSFSNIISLAAISAASLGFKPRITNPLARAMKFSGAKDAAGWCVAQSCLWNLDEASRSYAFFASGSLRSDGRGKVQPHREQVQPVRRWSDTQVSDLAITLYDPRGIIGR